jgi:hypothetical protein
MVAMDNEEQPGAAAFLYDQNGQPYAVYAGRSLMEVEVYASDWMHGVQYWTADSHDELAPPSPS